MSMAEMSVVMAGLVVPGVVVLAVILFALYWIVRKAVRDGIRDANCGGIDQKVSRSSSNE